MKSLDLFSPETPRGWLPWGLFAPVLGLLFLLGSDLLGDPLLRSVTSLTAKGLPTELPGFVAFLLLGFLPMLGLVLIWVLAVERRSLASIGWTGENKARTFAMGHGIGMLSILGIVGAIAWAGGLQLATGLPRTTESLLWIAVLLPSFVFQASTEEVLFRGWLLSVLGKKFNVGLAVLLSTALFTLAHYSRGQAPLVTASSALFGLFCCAWTLRTRSLLGVMGWHAGWNWLLAVGFGLPVTGIDVGIPALLVTLKPVAADWLTGGADGPEGSVVCLAYFVMGIACLVWRRRLG